MKKLTRKQVSIGAVGVVVILALVLVVTSALAQLSNSDFEIDEDANLIVDGTDPPSLDWDNVIYLPKPDANSGQTDDSFGQGTKEDSPVPIVVSGSIPPNKSDLKTFGIYQEENDDGKFLHVFWTRVQDPSGTTNMDFEFNQSSTLSANGITYERTSGDFLIVYELSKGGTVPVLAKYEWYDGTEEPPVADSICDSANNFPCWGNRTDLTAGGAAFASINSSAIAAADSAGLGPLDPRTFGEASIDLDFIFDSGECESFGSAYLKSRSSDSFTSALKDFIAPLPINISNCGQILIHKETDPDGATGVFTFTKSFQGSDITFDLSDGDTYTDSVALAGTYTITESIMPANFDFDRVECVQGAGYVGPAISASPTITFELAVGESADCTYYNQQDANIIVEKQTNPEGSTQSFDFETSWEDDFSLADGGTRDSGDLDPGTYVITETVPTGWELESTSCVSSKGDTETVKNVSLQAGETVTCTYTNEQDAFIIVQKETDPDGSPQLFTFSTNYGADFDLADGGSNNSGDLDPDVTYSVSETEPDGWDLTSSPCTSSNGDSETNGSISLQAGETVTCTFYNQQDAFIVVEKETDPDGSTESFDFETSWGDDFSLTDDGSKTSDDLVPGTYVITETMKSGWELVSTSCVSSKGDLTETVKNVSLQAGETITCTFNNSTGAILISKTTKDKSGEGGVSPLAGVTFSITNSSGAEVATVVTGDDGTYCVDELIAGDTYTITEMLAPEGYDPSMVAPQQVVAAAAECEGAGTPTPANFVNVPLSKIEITFYSLAGDGVTVAVPVSCSGPSDSTDGSDQGELGNGESHFFTDLIPGDYTCYITVDP